MPENMKVMVDDEKLEVVQELCYLGDMLSAGVVLSWLQLHATSVFGASLPTASSSHQRQPAASDPTCVRSVMLHAAETWSIKMDTLNRL